MRRPLVLSLVSVVAAVLMAATLVAANPATARRRHYVQYVGAVHVDGWASHVRFRTNHKRTKAYNFKMPQGPPTASTCAAGPWGHPVSHRVRIRHHRFSARMRLFANKDNPDVGWVRVWGRIGKKHVFRGYVHTHAMKGCTGTFHLVARVR